MQCGSRRRGLPSGEPDGPCWTTRSSNAWFLPTRLACGPSWKPRANRFVTARKSATRISGERWRSRSPAREFLVREEAGADLARSDFRPLLRLQRSSHPFRSRGEIAGHFRSAVFQTCHLPYRLSHLTHRANHLTHRVDHSLCRANGLTHGADDLSPEANDLIHGASHLTHGADKLIRGADDLTQGASCLTHGASALPRGATHPPQVTEGLLSEREGPPHAAS